MAQLVKRPTLDFGLGHDLTVREIEPRVCLRAGTEEPAWDSVSLSLSDPSPCALFLKINKHKKIKNTNM